MAAVEPTARPGQDSGAPAGCLVVVSHPRSGSNFLREILNQHPNIYHAGEVFHGNPAILRSMREWINRFQPGAEQIDEADMDRLVTLDRFDAFAGRCREVTGRAVLGLNLFCPEIHSALDDAAVDRLVLRPEVAPVFLIRRNLLKAYVSVVRALTTGAWHVERDGTLRQYSHSLSPDNALIREIGAIDPTAAQAWIRLNRQFLERVEAALRRAGKPFLTLHYEDLCLAGDAGTRQEIDRVLGFLGLEALPHFEVNLAQTASEEFYRAIPNRQELSEATGYDLEPPPASPHGWVSRTNLQVARWQAADQSIALAPAGRYARNLLEQTDLKFARVAALFDRAPGAPWREIPVRPYEDLGRVRPDAVLVASPLMEVEIARELLARGYPEERIFRLSALPAM